MPKRNYLLYKLQRPFQMQQQGMQDSSSRAFDFLIESPGQILTTMRNQEIRNIESFIEECAGGALRPGSHKSRICYIVGPPGTGKTSSMRVILRRMADRGFKIVSMNANMVRKTRDIQDFVGKTLEPIGRPQASIDCSAADKFRRRAKKIKKDDKRVKAQFDSAPKIKLDQQKGPEICIVYVEEAELVARANSPEELQEFLNMFQSDEGPIYILLAVSNDHMIKDTFCKKMSHVSIKEGTRLVLYDSYSTEEMYCIMRQKLQQAETYLGVTLCIGDALIKLTVNKIEGSKKGDIRILLEFMKMLFLEVMAVLKKDERPEEREREREREKEREKEGLSQSQPLSEGEGEETFTIEFPLVNKVLSRLKSEKSTFISKLSFNQQIILTLIFAYVKRTEAIQIPYLEVVHQIKKCYSDLGITFNDSAIQGIQELESYDMIFIRRKSGGKKRKSDSESKIILKVGLSEIEAGIAHNELLTRLYV